MKKMLMIFMVVILVSGFSGMVFALTAEEVVNKANQVFYYQADDGRAEANITITDSLGRTRKRNMVILRLDSPDNEHQKYYVYFKKPSDVQGMAYLVWKKPGEDDDRWLYLPALDLVKRVASSDKRSSFVGSDFTYEDISGRGTEEDTHSIKSENDKEYVIKSVPKDPNSVEFSYFVTTIRKKDFLPVKVKLYDKNGKLYKIMEALEIKDIQGYPTVTEMKATDLNSGGNTVSKFSNIQYNIGLDDSIFTERYLRKPPRKYIK